MFKKLLSNLPFNPSLIGQVSFYARRVHSEETVRRTGLFVVVLAVLVQLFAVLSPPEHTLAESPNDIIRGGFTSKDQAVAHCKNGTKDLKDILAYYRVTCDLLAKATTKSIRSTAHSKQLHSMGRTPQGQTIKRTGKSTGEYAVKISGRTYYMRNLWAWDSGAYSTYKVLEMKNLDGKVIMLMYSCGNIVTIGKYTPPAPVLTPKPQPAPKPTPVPLPQPVPKPTPKPEPKPEPKPVTPTPLCEDVDKCLEYRKTAQNITQRLENADNTKAEASDEITYTLYTTNTSSATIRDFAVRENMNDVLDYADIIDPHGGSLDEENILIWPAITLSPKQTIENSITIRVKSPIPNTPASLSDPGHFDLIMTNVYGNAINIEVAPSLSKTTETVVTTLPNTGPGEALIAITSLTMVVSYFYFRSRLMAKELDIVRTDYSVRGRT